MGADVRSNRGVRQTGIIRHLDELGRIVIPIEIRKRFGLTEKDVFSAGVRARSRSTVAGRSATAASRSWRRRTPRAATAPSRRPSDAAEPTHAIGEPRSAFCWAGRVRRGDATNRRSSRGSSCIRGGRLGLAPRGAAARPGDRLPAREPLRPSVGLEACADGNRCADRSPADPREARAFVLPSGPDAAGDSAADTSAVPGSEPRPSAGDPTAAVGASAPSASPAPGFAAA
jgi:hypothetical protein